MNNTEVVIAGAGIIGLSLALDLATHGLSVTVLERGRAMAESSWAAAGMLAGDDPELHPQLQPLAQYSLSVYPEFLARVENLSARQIPLRTSYVLQALDPHSDKARSATAQRSLSAAELRTLAPGLSAGDYHWIRRDGHSLDPRDLCAALPIAARAAGVDLREESAVTALESKAGRFLIHTPSSAIAATHFVNATGAWSGSTPFAPPTATDRSDATNPRIFPSKGQILAVREPGPNRLPCVLRTPKIYLVPRGDGRIVIGATMEDAGFDKSVEPRAIAALIQAAAELYPPIANSEVTETWAGLRPGSSDELPFIGAVDTPPQSTSPRHFLATGHFRNGILLAPGTARTLSRLIRGLDAEIDLASFDPNRKTTAFEGARLQPCQV